jgi:hypothetical protein
VTILKWLAKSHAYAFYALRKGNYYKSLADWNSHLLISIAMEFCAITIVNLLSIELHRRIALARYKETGVMLFWLMLCAAIYGINYVSLMMNQRGSRFDREFQHYPRLWRIVGVTAVWGAFSLIIVVTFWIGSLLPPP